jgi:hypothetical protein
MRYISGMADAVEPGQRDQRRELARSRRRNDDLWIGITALVAAMLALPLAQSSWHGPEVAATLAVSAVALLSGQRWAIALVFIAQVLLLPTICPRAFFGGVELWPARIAALGAVLMVVPGLLNARRAAAAMLLVAGLQHTRLTARRVHYAFAAASILAAALPLF